MPLCYSAIPSRSLRRDGADLKGFGISQQAFCRAKFAFAQRSGAMKAPVGLLSDRTVCDSRWRGFAPTSSQMYIRLPCLLVQWCWFWEAHSQWAIQMPKPKLQWRCAERTMCCLLVMYPSVLTAAKRFIFLTPYSPSHLSANAFKSPIWFTRCHSIVESGWIFYFALLYTIHGLRGWVTWTTSP